MTRLAVGLIFVVFLTSCTSAIVVHDRSEVVVTRKFGPSDLTSLAAKLMKELDNCHDDWTKSKPTLAIADIYNDTDKPGLNKQPIFDEFGSAIYKMKKFNLINHRKTDTSSISGLNNHTQTCSYCMSPSENRRSELCPVVSVS